MLSYKLHPLSRRTKLALAGITVVVLGLLVTVAVSKQQQNILQHAAADTVAISVDNTKPHQTWEGFGTTTGVLAGPTWDDFSSEERNKMIDAVYGQVKINSGYFNGTGEDPNDNTDPSTFNWPGFDSSYLPVYKQKLVDLAEPLGFNNYLLDGQMCMTWANAWLKSLANTDYNRRVSKMAFGC